MVVWSNQLHWFIVLVIIVHEVCIHICSWPEYNRSLEWCKGIRGSSRGPWWLSSTRWVNLGITGMNVSETMPYLPQKWCCFYLFPNTLMSIYIYIYHCVNIYYLHSLWISSTYSRWSIFLLVGGLEHFLFSHILGMSSSQLTNIFQRGSNHQPPINCGDWGDGADGFFCFYPHDLRWSTFTS